MSFPITVKRLRPKKNYGPNFSKWYLLLNSQIKPKNQNREYEIKTEFEEIIEEVLSDEENILLFLDRENPDPLAILDVELEFNIEMGAHKKGGRIHSHMALSITHETIIKINNKKFRQLIIPILHSRIPESKGIFLSWTFARAEVTMYNQNRYLTKPTL